MRSLCYGWTISPIQVGLIRNSLPPSPKNVSTSGIRWRHDQIFSNFLREREELRYNDGLALASNDWEISLALDCRVDCSRELHLYSLSFFLSNWFLVKGHLICVQSPLTFGCTRQVIPPPWYKERGMMEPPLGFWHVAIFRNDFAFSGKPLILSTRWGILYGWWRWWRSVTVTVVATLAAIFFLSRIRNYAKLNSEKNTNNYVALFYPQTLLLSLKKGWKNMHFH